MTPEDARRSFDVLCKDCRKHLEAMKTEMVSERYVKKTAEEIQEEIYPFKKLKKKTVR